MIFDGTIKSYDFINNEDEICVYMKIDGSVTKFLVLYVDDILLIGNDKKYIMVNKLISVK